MGNFDFLRTDWPEIHSDCVRAEGYLTSDPRAACIYSRRAVEHLVTYLYELLQLPEPYRDDLAARVHEPAFRRHAAARVVEKLDLIRRLGNGAVHGDCGVRPRDAETALRELFHVMVWAGLNFSPNPDAVPQGRQFDAALAARSAPLSRDQVRQVLQRFRDADAARQTELEHSQQRAAELEAELAAARAELDAAQAAQTVVDDHDYDEAETRDRFIDVLLREAGWLLDQPRDIEYPVTGMPTPTGTGRVDYVLWGADGRPLALVEAKRTRRSPQEGQHQASLYADALEREFGRRPVMFYTNGYEHWLWDDAAGYPPREVQGFFTADELELMIQRRETRRRLSNEPISSAIVDRFYQSRAIRAVDGAFDARQREALLVMATGAGKTRTVIALAQQLMRANWAKRVLFLADRTALVRQASNAFRDQLPDATTVNLVENRAGDGRVYVSTYPTMLNLVNQVDESGRRFGPGYFDLIIIDEAHRSIYAKYGAIFDYFDALLVGLTATPKDEVDHNTYRRFHLEDGVPTDAYGLDEAVRDHYLVPPFGVASGTRFTRSGVRYADLTEAEKDQWDSLDWGDGGRPDEVGAEELNRFLFNEDTVDKVLGQLMTDGYKVDGDDRLAKTIIFAKNQAHAEFIQQRFDLGWPQHAGHFAKVITHATSHSDDLITKFADPGSEPHIAISVDMLDTGIDVPDVANLVFFKLVRSKSKFWQMIGRGTRLRPDLFGPGRDKTDFFVFDYCGNLEYFSQDLPGSTGSLQVSLTQRIFEARLAMLQALDAAHTEAGLRASTASALHEFVAGMTLDNVLVRPHREAVERFAEADSWQELTTTDANQALSLAGLPSSLREADEKAKRFDLLILRRQLAQLQGDLVECERVRHVVQELAEALLAKTNVPMVAQQAEQLEALISDEWWADVTLPMLEVARLRVRGLIGLIDPNPRSRVYTDFEDALIESTPIELPGTTPGTNFERFRARARSYLRAHEDHVALQRLLRNKQLTPADLQELGEMLVDAGANDSDLAAAENQSGGLGLFIRSLVGLDRSAAVEAFARFLDGGTYSINQVRFVNLIVDELTRTGAMETGRLFESPFTDSAPTGPDFIFAEGDIQAIVDILDTVKRHAVADGVA